jgi:antitoxin (DNA-binding transcriptional repressor) of toxin-antitoxin stability system
MIIIASNGRPVAKLVPIDVAPRRRHICVAKDRFVVPDDINLHNEDVAKLFFSAENF